MAKKKSTELKAAIKARLQALSALTDEARISEEMQSYLQFLGRFHQYSFNNTLLILMSNPDATLVAGYRKWQSMGFQVQKGEKGIPILAPQTYAKSKESTAATSGELVVEVESESASDKGQTKTGTWFRTVHVFDVSQVGIPCPQCKALASHDATHCPECGTKLDASLPQAPQWINEGADGAGLAARLQSYAQCQGIEVVESDLPGTRQGESHIGKVVLRTGLSPLGRASILAHEIAHELLHTKQDRKTLSKAVKETEAEATAYAVCAHFGYEITSPNYIAMWSGDSALLQQRMNRISQAAKQ
ncbi:MAG: ImmA/IrrE family metallo-endopeptidase, partial [Chloroflexi bacterium]|nr:ImmA/IrrE family metallo-endopeptidase [Chloroflexota bacterium]